MSYQSVKRFQHSKGQEPTKLRKIATPENGLNVTICVRKFAHEFPIKLIQFGKENLSSIRNFSFIGFDSTLIGSVQQYKNVDPFTVNEFRLIGIN